LISFPEIKDFNMASFSSSETFLGKINK